MSHPTLTAQPRTEFGNGPARRLRKQGLVPGVLYAASGAGASVPFTVEERALRRAILVEKSQAVEITVGDDAPVTAIVADYDLDPVRGEFVHVDLQPASEAEIAEAVAEAQAAEAEAAEARAQAVAHAEHAPEETVGEADESEEEAE
jgi:large subunit ribosomal protein L25